MQTVKYCSSLTQRDIFFLIQRNKVFHKPQISTELCVHHLWHRLALLQLIKLSNWAWELWIRDGEIWFVTLGFPQEEAGTLSDGMKGVVTREASPWFILRDTGALKRTDPRHSFHFPFPVTEMWPHFQGHVYRLGVLFPHYLYVILWEVATRQVEFRCF